MRQYLDLCKHILENGTFKKDRTGTGTLSVFGYQTRYDLQKGFPLVTTKKTHMKSIIHELLWFISGNTNTKYLTDNGITIWNEWADENGDLGPIYGHQWRHWTNLTFNMKLSAGDCYINNEIDQLKQVIEDIKTNPDSRRLLVNAWNVSDIKKMALPPCHLIFQFYTREINKYKIQQDLYDNNIADLRFSEIDSYLENHPEIPTRYLDCQLYQRSADVFLGVPFNIASYSLLIHMIANICNMLPGEFIHTIGDAHIYTNHIDQVKLQLSREPKMLPKLILQNKQNIDDFKFEDFKITNYDPHPSIKGDISI